MKKTPKNAEIFNCIFCDFRCSKLSEWERHTLTRKHKNRTILNKKTPNQIYNCKFCNKPYTVRNSLWYHEKKCNYDFEKQQPHDTFSSNLSNDTQNNVISTELILELIKQNSELQKYILEASNTVITNTNCNNNSNNTTNNNNNHFNLNVFLNETCKDAMNISEFIEQLPIYLSDLEDTARLGFAEGLSRIFIRGLKQLDINQRPIHCSDAKRETLYIKDNDKWEKDDSNKSKLETAVRKVGTKNIRMIPEWRKQHPNCTDADSNKNDLYLKIVGNSMCGGTVEETEHNYSKIKHNIIKQVVIPK
jgi:hypothetical protein